MSLNKQFEIVINTPLSSLTIENFKPIALGIWHENYLPQLENLEIEKLQKAGYLIDRLMRFNCISDRQRLRLMKLVEEIKCSLPSNMLTPSSLTRVEPLAQKWNLNEDISHVIQPLLQYQTRHYHHTKTPKS